MTDAGNGGGERPAGAVRFDRGADASEVGRSADVTFRRDHETRVLTDFCARRGSDVVEETVLARRLS
jgi:hypothetical protein